MLDDPAIDLQQQASYKILTPYCLVVSQSLLMRLLAPCCAHCWKTAPCPSTTAPSGSSKTTMDVCCASASAVSAVFLHVPQLPVVMLVLGFFALKCQLNLPVCSRRCQKRWTLMDWFSRKRANSKDIGLFYGRSQRRLDTRMLPQAALLQLSTFDELLAPQWTTSSSTLSDDSCPDLEKYCSLQCPTGYERDDFGCEVCECSNPMPKCRPLVCTKTCPYGYVWVNLLLLCPSKPDCTHLSPTFWGNDTWGPWREYIWGNATLCSQKTEKSAVAGGNWLFFPYEFSPWKRYIYGDLERTFLVFLPCVRLEGTNRTA